MERKRAEVFLALGFLFSWCCVTNVAAMDDKDAFLLRLLENENLERCFSNRLYTQELLNPGAEFDQYLGQERFKKFAKARKAQALQRAKEERKSLRAECLRDKLSFCDRELKEDPVLLEHCQILVARVTPCTDPQEEPERLGCFQELMERWKENPEVFVQQHKAKVLADSPPPSEESAIQWRADETRNLLSKAVDYGTLINAKADIWVITLSVYGKAGLIQGLADSISDDLSDLRVSLSRLEGELKQAGGGYNFSQSQPEAYFAAQEQQARQLASQMWDRLESIRKVGRNLGIYISSDTTEQVLKTVNAHRALNHLSALTWSDFPASSKQMLLELRRLRDQVLRPY